MKRKYKIWSIEHGAWWKPGSCGYTPYSSEAGEYPEETAFAIVKDANKTGLNEIMFPIRSLSLSTEDIESLLFEIYRVDKTPEYGYSKTKKDQTAGGEIAGVGKRWLTPREIIRDRFGLEFWDKYNEWKSR